MFYNFHFQVYLCERIVRQTSLITAPTFHRNLLKLNCCCYMENVGKCEIHAKKELCLSNLVPLLFDFCCFFALLMLFLFFFIFALLFIFMFMTSLEFLSKKFFLYELCEWAYSKYHFEYLRIIVVNKQVRIITPHKFLEKVKDKGCRYYSTEKYHFFSFTQNYLNSIKVYLELSILIPET